MNLKQYKYCQHSLVNLIVLSAGLFAVSAEKARSLPRIDTLDTNPSYVSRNTNNQKSLREYTFKAPGNKTLGSTEYLAVVDGYKVEVYGNSADLLQQVRNIEPSAFIQGNNIQVGIFSQQNNAEDLVRQLAIAGFWARIKIQ
ncbi:MAG: SPOR domain-containing protein [Cyanobacteria bacterium J06621_8]